MSCLQVQLDAQLTAGPASSSNSNFPGGVTTISFGLCPPAKGYNVNASGAIQVNSPSSFTPVDSIGMGGQVTQVTTLYLRATGPMQVQKTYNNLSGSGTTTIVDVVSGVMLIEYPSNAPLVALAFQGTGTVEYWVAGPQ